MNFKVKWGRRSRRAVRQPRRRAVRPTGASSSSLAATPTCAQSSSAEEQPCGRAVGLFDSHAEECPSVAPTNSPNPAPTHNLAASLTNNPTNEVKIIDDKGVVAKIGQRPRSIMGRRPAAWSQRSPSTPWLTVAVELTSQAETIDAKVARSEVANIGFDSFTDGCRRCQYTGGENELHAMR